MFASPGLLCSIGLVFYRAFVGAIILFWLWMTALLVRGTWFPQSGEPIAIPTAYVWKLVFLHEEPSDLTVYNGRQRVGNLHLQPHRQMVERDGKNRTERQLKLVGGFNVDWAWTGRQSVILHGTLDLGEKDEITHLRLSAVFHDTRPTTPGTAVVLDGTPSADQWHYSVQQGDLMLEERSGSVAQMLDRPELRALGLDPAAFARVQGQQVSKASTTARRGKLQMNHDEIDTYVVTFKDGNGLESSVHLNQLGQILAVTTFAGLSLLDAALNP